MFISVATIIPVQCGRCRRAIGRSALGLLAVVFSGSAFGAAAKKSPASKLFVADIEGVAEVSFQDRIVPLTKKSVVSAEGVVLETKKAPDNKDGVVPYSAMVFSNGTGMVMAGDSRIEVQQFQQEPFTPARSDMDLEPSISQTQALVQRGTIGLCTSKLAAGSKMVYQTPHGSVNVRARRMVIETNDDYTRIVVLEGESTVRAGTGSGVDMGGQTLHAGEQAILRNGPTGDSAPVSVEKISDREAEMLGNAVAPACLAKKTVYFDTVSRSNSSNPFEDEGAQEIVAKEVVPVDLPTQYTVSAAVIHDEAGKK
jgi:hypothetical protein